MSDITLRPAKRSEAADLAILDNIAGFGLSHEYWQSITPSRRIEDAYAVGRQQFADDSVANGWRNATVAIQNDLILGMSTCFFIRPPDYNDKLPGSDEQNRNSALPTSSTSLEELYALSVHHWYMHSLAVFPEARGKGIGALLIDDFIEQGREKAASQMSLIAESGNRNAIELYRSYGFETTATRSIIEFNSPFGSKEWLLMTLKQF